MVHGRQQLFRWDNNNDGYLDAPLSQHIIQNAWKHNGKNSEAQFGVKASAIKTWGSTLYGYPRWFQFGHTNYKPNAASCGPNAVIFLMEVSIAVLGHNSRPPTKILTVTLATYCLPEKSNAYMEPDFPRQFVGYEAHLQRRTRFECLCD